MTQIYGVTGMPMAGKTTVAEALEDEGFSVLDMGDVVRTEMEKRCKDVSETGEFVNGLREEKGMDAIAQLSTPYLQEILGEQKKVVITGMRGWNEKERFEDETGEKIEVIAVWASREERKRRREQRQRDEDIKGDEFHERDLREIQQGVGKLMALSDHMMKNDTITQEEFEEKVKDLAKS
ncbi:MAG: dephospho-CoA kinase [Nanohaloarchaea archaeon SW_7_46_7]|nr:MAG: dephospho-CoA kinase [Nanohaloarchaea archaeon SW_7_46_7]